MTDWLTTTEPDLTTELAEVEAQITAYRAAITARATGATSYKLDTGQTSESVTKASLGELRLMLRDLLAERDSILERVNGTGSHYARPHF